MVLGDRLGGLAVKQWQDDVVHHMGGERFVDRLALDDHPVDEEGGNHLIQ